MRIAHRKDSDESIFESEHGNMKDTVEAARRDGVCLADSCLSGADLNGACLRNMNLRGCDLREAYLMGADLRGCDLTDARLISANLTGANLRGASLRHADLRYAIGCDADWRDTDLRASDCECLNLSGAQLRGVRLHGVELMDVNFEHADMPWGSHDVMAELLRRAAGIDRGKIGFAGTVKLQRHWCWDDYIQMNHPFLEWALQALSEWVVESGYS